MDKIKNYEDFELDDYKGDNKQSNRKTRSKAKIMILFSLIIIFEIIYIVCIQSIVRKKNDELSKLNFKKYLLNDGNEKLYKELNDDLLTTYSLNDELVKKGKEILKREEGIINYIQKSNYLLTNFSPTPESLLILQKENDNKKLKINELVLTLINNEKDFKEVFKTKIIDSRSELNKIQLIVKKYNVSNFKLCYTGEDKELNFTEAYNKCNFDEDIPILIFIQTEIYERYGIYLSTQKEKKSIVFAFKSGKQIEIEYVKFNKNQRQSLIYLINLIKNMKTKKKDKEKNDIKDFDIMDLEIFHLLF